MAGFFDGLTDSIQNPLFLGGIGLMTGGGEGLQRGLLAGNQMQEQARKRKSQEAMQNGLMAMQGVSDQDKQILSASPELLQHFMLQRMTPEKPTDDQREYAMARKQGFGGSFMDYVTAVKRAGAPSTNIDMKQESAYDKEIGGLLAKDFIEFQKQGTKSQQDIGDLEVMRKSMENPNVYMGTGGNQVQAVKKAAQSIFGIDVEGVPDGEVIQRTSAKAALGLKDNLPGPMSDSDRKFLMELPANLSATPEGARRVVSLGIEQKRWQAERANVARQFAAKNGGRLTPEVYGVLADIDRQFASRMSQHVDSLRGQAQSAPRAPTAGTPIDALRRKYKGLE